ncbi:lactonase family protein [Paracoccus sp. KR1-242]|uniref:lactonase family protein n=1 Tax=Paracoccus sp. KR1-242 TaxID=3410028 RepID=UPI003C0804B4
MTGDLLLFIGTLNREAPYFQGARGEGLCVFRFDEAKLGFERLASYPQVENPTYLSVTPDGRHVYANSEVADWREGLVTAFAFDPQARRLTYLNTQPALGSITAHNAISADGRHLFVANYSVGEGGPDKALAVLPLRTDGTLAPAIAGIARQGTGPVQDRQERSHAHSVTETRQGGMVILADLGTDELATYRIGADGMPVLIATSRTASGAGPRHLALHPDGRFLFAINELDSTVTAHDLDPASGQIHAIDSQSTVPAEARDHNHCSDIQISPDGRFIYAGNRGHDSIAIFEIDQNSGRLSPRGHVPCGGSTPRNLALTPSGGHLLVANQNSDRVSVLARDAASGALTDTGVALNIGTPMCLKFAKV